MNFLIFWLLSLLAIYFIYLFQKDEYKHDIVYQQQNKWRIIFKRVGYGILYLILTESILATVCFPPQNSYYEDADIYDIEHYEPKY